MSKQLNILLVEDSQLLRAQLKETIDEINGTVVVGFAEDESSAIEELAKLHVNLVVVDLELKSGSGFGVLRALKSDPERFHNAVGVVLTTFSNPSVMRYCRQLGAVACFDKAMQMDSFVEFIEASSRNGVPVAQ